MHTHNLLAEVRRRAWIVAALLLVVAAVGGTQRLTLITTVATLIAGILIMWKSEEGQVRAEAGPDPSPLPAPVLNPTV